jgi:predicted RNA-binding Zn-ribbon protein involved in translation (DUF1610 family)
MVSYTCPNCGRVYNYGEELPYGYLKCMNCRYPLKLSSEVKEVKNPVKRNVIGIIGSNNTPKCPTCGSTNVKSISMGNRWLSIGLFGLASSKIGKSMECKNCGYKW